MRTLITKKIKMYGDEGVTYAWLIVNKCDKTVELRLAGGKAPKWELGIAALLLDKDVRKMVQEYCITAPRKNYFNLYCREGMSGCRDICINILKKIGEKFRITKKVKLIHISCQDIKPENMLKVLEGNYSVRNNSKSEEHSYDLEMFDIVAV